MNHLIRIKQGKGGYFQVELDSVVIAYGLSFEQMDWLVRGVGQAFNSMRGHTIEYNDDYYEIMIANR